LGTQVITIKQHGLSAAILQSLPKCRGRGPLLQHCNLIAVTQAGAGRGLQPRPKRLTDEDMAVVIETGAAIAVISYGTHYRGLVVHACDVRWNLAVSFDS